MVISAHHAQVTVGIDATSFLLTFAIDASLILKAILMLGATFGAGTLAIYTLGIMIRGAIGVFLASYTSRLFANETLEAVDVFQAIQAAITILACGGRATILIKFASTGDANVLVTYQSGRA